MKKTKITENFHMMKNLMKKIFNFMMTGMKMETMPRTISRQKRKSSKKRVKITMMKRRIPIFLVVEIVQLNVPCFTFV